MSYENLYPIHTSLILEKASLVTWENKSMEFNTTTTWVDNSWYFVFNQVIRYEMYYQNTWVTEQSVIDNTNNNYLIRNSSKLTLFNLYYSYYSKNRNLVLTNVIDNSVTSIDKMFKNCNWLERESSEMYGLNFLFKSDTRKLLLDYSKAEHPLLKDFPTEGLNDVFYDLLDNQVSYRNNETTEL